MVFVGAFGKLLLGMRMTKAEAKELRRRRLPDGSYRFGNRADRLARPELEALLG